MPMMKLHPLLLVLLATATPVLADVPHKAPPGDALTDYVRARVADDLGELDTAADGFAAAAARNPSDDALVLRAYRQALIAGDMALAVQSAKALDARRSLPPDGSLLLLGDAVQRKDWRQARAWADRITAEKLFAFLVPTIRAWIAYGSHDGNPLATIQGLTTGGLAATYSDEHLALLQIATRKDAAGLAAIATLRLPDSDRDARLRIAAAAMLQDQRRDADAAAILAGQSPALVRARALLAAHRRLPGAIDTPAKGIAELYVRVASDLNRDRSVPLALGLARMSTMLAPDASEGWLITANLLAMSDAQQAALDALGHVAPDDPFAGSMRDLRLTLLVRTGHIDQALAEAQAAVHAEGATSGDWSRLGDLLVNAKRQGEAAQAYAQALELAGGAGAPPEVAWPLLLQQASTLLESGDWPNARVRAAQALALAPQQPAILNFLGYSELEHGEDAAGAGAMIAKASELAPGDPAITDSLGWSWYLRGDLDRAIPLLEQAAQGAPAESDINEHLGDAYWKADRRLAARYAWRAALVVADADQTTRIKAKIANGLTARP